VARQFFWFWGWWLGLFGLLLVTPWMWTAPVSRHVAMDDEADLCSGLGAVWWLVTSLESRSRSYEPLSRRC
jgi:hypothetical protein